jgi:hypothetical protein
VLERRGRKTYSMAWKLDIKMIMTEGDKNNKSRTGYSEGV